MELSCYLVYLDFKPMRMPPTPQTTIGGLELYLCYSYNILYDLSV